MINTENDRVEVWQDARGKYRWHRFDDDNGVIVSESGQGYASQDYAVEAARAYNSDLREEDDFFLTPERR